MIKYFAPVIRLYRYLLSKCIVCGKSNKDNNGKHWYCSFQCFCYDGGTLRKDRMKYEISNLWWTRKPSLIFGVVTNYKEFWKYRDKK